MRKPKGNFLIATDWHGNGHQGREIIFQAERLGLDTIIHLGDFGIKESSYNYLGHLQKYLGAFGINLYFIDGNHEHFDKLENREMLDDGTRFVRDNIFHLPRGFRWSWNDISFLAVGGAASINRFSSSSGSSHWDPGEFITDSDVEKAIEGGSADVMFMHDSPADAPNDLVDDTELQQELIKKFGLASVAYTYANREQLKAITAEVNPRLLFHGHYHKAMYHKYQHEKSQKYAKIWCINQGTVPLSSSSSLVFDFYRAKHDISRLRSKDTK
jgi:predicted phosphodiesterase